MNVNDLLIQLTIISDDRISLRRRPPGISITQNSPMQLTLESPDGFDVASLLELEFVSASATSPVFAEFTLTNGVSFGPFSIDTTVIPEPATGSLLALGIAFAGMFRRTRRWPRDSGVL